MSYHREAFANEAVKVSKQSKNSVLHVLKLTSGSTGTLNDLTQTATKLADQFPLLGSVWSSIPFTPFAFGD
jgi:hypothetical protein